MSREVNCQMYNTKELSDQIYKLSMKMALGAGKNGSHIGGSLSCVEIFAVLYNDIMNYDIKNPLWEDRDRFVASKAHCILSHFSTLSLMGYFPESELDSFHINDGLLCGHPYNPSIGLEFSGGSLGMGISVGVGMALIAKKEHKLHKVYVLLGDGEANEGSVWEAFMSAAQFKLDNLTVIIDYNNMQFDDKNDNVMSLAPIAEKMAAFGFTVIEVNGHDIYELKKAFEGSSQGRPKAIVAHTVKARGVQRIENKSESHQISIDEKDYLDALSWREGV